MPFKSFGETGVAVKPTVCRYLGNAKCFIGFELKSSSFYPFSQYKLIRRFACDGSKYSVEMKWRIMSFFCNDRKIEWPVEMIRNVLY